MQHEVVTSVSTAARARAKVLHGHLPGAVPQLEVLQKNQLAAMFKQKYATEWHK